MPQLCAQRYRRIRFSFEQRLFDPEPVDHLARADVASRDPARVPLSIWRSGFLRREWFWPHADAGYQFGRIRPLRLYFVFVIIHELTRPECVEVLQRAHVGRLACVRDAQPYIVPISFYFDGHDTCLYSFSTVGQKIHWMRDNPKVCVEVDDVVDRFNWITVVVTGLYEELREATEAARAKRRALKLFEERSEFWLPGLAKLSTGMEHTTAVVYRIQIVTMSGRRAARASRGPER